MASRSYGWIRQPFDPRDRKFTVGKRLTASLPPVMDLSSNMGQLLDQGALGSCGPNTADELIEYDQKVERLTVSSVSRLFVYYTTRTLMGTTSQDSGVDNRTLLKALAQYGYPDESLWPYDISKFRTKPPANVYQAALVNRIISYAAVATQLDQMRGCIAAGYPFMFGFQVFQQIESDQAAQDGILTTPAPGDTPIGGHDVTIFAYDDAKQMFKFRNHWRNGDGTPWGDNGCGWIPYAYATNANLCSDFWVITAVPGAAPAPPVPPVPPGPPPVPPVPPTPPGPTTTLPGGSYILNRNSLYSFATQ